MIGVRKSIKIGTFKILVVVVLLSVSIVGCMPSQEVSQTSGEVMKVATYYWPGQFWTEIADEKGFFEEAGLNVELVDTNVDYFGSLQDMVDGNIDVNMFVLYDLIDFNAKGADLVSVINVDISAGADSIVSKNEIERIADLKGKKIGLQQETYSEYMFQVVIEQNGLTTDDVIIVETKAEDIEPLVNGEVDALVAFEPFASEAVDKANGRKIFDTSQMPGLIPDVMAFHKSFIDERPEDVQSFVQVWYRTTEFITNNPKEAFGIIAKNYADTPGDVQAFTDEVKILNLRDNKVSFSYASGFESLHGTAREINTYMLENNITNKRLDSTDFIDARFIRGVAE
jgi:NitT/TauT family transport system substrate-binding protein